MYSVLMPLLLAGCVYYGVQLGRYPVGFSYYMLGMSLISMLLYALDKSAAVSQRRRVPEDRLHILSLSGGWPGAMLAQQMFNHKTTKVSFRALFWATVVLNSAMLTLFFIDDNPLAGVLALFEAIESRL